MSDPGFNELLDEILQNDAQVEPLVGIEGRVMQRLAATSLSLWRWRLLGWGTGLAVPPCLALGMLFMQKSSSIQELPVVAKVPSGATLMKPAIEEGLSQGQVARKSPHVARDIGAYRKVEAVGTSERGTDSLPKLDVFPIPSLPEEAVRELAAFSPKHVKLLGIADTSSQGRPPAALEVEPITIAKIETTPLFPPPEKLAEKSEEHKELK